MEWLIFGALAVGLFFYEKNKKSGGPSVTNQQTVATAAEMLAAFAASQGAQYQPTGNVGDPNDPTFKNWVKMFQVYANHGGVPGSALRTDGILDEATLATLQFWFQHSPQAGAIQ